MTRGIIIAVPQKYESLTYKNILKIRLTYKCNLPIEIWEIGNEMSVNIRNNIRKLDSTITFKNVTDYTDNPEHWKGFQVKVFMLKYTSFDEVILCDADIIFYQNPELLFDEPNYKETGAYFFKDLDSWEFSNLSMTPRDKFNSLPFFNYRKNWLRSLLPIKSKYFPKEWDYIYESDTPKKPVKEALQESGCVYMDRNRHSISIECIYKLNDNHKETYKYVWGDKETFWIGCLMADQPFYFNETSGYMNASGFLAHNYKEKLFFSQKG
jgi:hypothetical protein